MNEAASLAERADDLEAQAAGHEAARPHTRFCPDLEVVGPVEAAGADRQRLALYNRETDTSYVLGMAEVTIAQLFDGHRGRDEVLQRAQACVSPRLTSDKLQAFEQRLLALGILVDAKQSARPGRTTVRKDPFAGLSFGPLKARILIPLINLRPDKHLDRLLRSAPWLVSRAFVAGCAALVAVALGLLVPRWQAFSSEVAHAYTGWQWLLWHYPIMITSVICHEIGHTLPCKKYGVSITEMGFGAYLLFVTGWARPVQREWIRLDRRQRMTTIIMGPCVSLVFSAVGVILWRLAPPGSLSAQLGAMMAVISTLAIIPTMLPIFNGDGYLFLTELLGIPALRQKSWRFMHDVVRGRADQTRHLTARRKLLFCTVAAGTIVSWALAWFGLYALFFR